jgi:phosphate-selective porin
MRLKGFVQVDGRSFRNWTLEDADADPDLEVRRSRIGAEVRWRRLKVEVEVDPADDEERLKDAFVAFKVVKALSLQAGRSKLPGSPERLRPAARTDLIERSLLASHLATDRGFGLVATGEVGKRFSYSAGVFAGDGQRAEARTGTTLAGRVEVRPAKALVAGASFSEGEVVAEKDRTSALALPNGLEGEAVSGHEFFDRHFVNGRRRRVGLDASWTIGPASLRAEALEVREERRGQGPLCEGLACEDLTEEVGRGWAFTGTCLVKGSKKRRGAVGTGALELALRYESLAFDDRNPTTTFESVTGRARNIRPAGVSAFTTGVSWWPLPWTRVMANVVWERFRDPLTTPELGKRGTYVTLLGRMQVRLP